VLQGEAAAETMLLLDITVVPTLLRVSPTTGEAQPVPLEAALEPSAVAAAADTAAGTAEAAFAEALTRHEAGQWAATLEGFARAWAAAEAAGAQERMADAAYNLAALLHMLGRTRLAVHYTALVRA